MIKWLVEHLVGWPWCKHKWTVIDRVIRTNDDGTAFGRKYYFQCERCGDVRAKSFTNGF